MEIAAVDAESTESDVELARQGRCLVDELLASTTNAFPGELRDGLESRRERITVRRNLLIELHRDVPKRRSAVCIGGQHCMRRRPGASKEVHDQIIPMRCDLEHAADQVGRFGKVHKRLAEQLLNGRTTAIIRKAGFVPDTLRKSSRRLPVIIFEIALPEHPPFIAQARGQKERGFRLYLVSPPSPASGRPIGGVWIDRPLAPLGVQRHRPISWRYIQRKI
ncbi:hypothetical protein D3C72_1648630 [compost metagenome]